MRMMIRLQYRFGLRVSLRRMKDGGDVIAREARGWRRQERARGRVVGVARRRLRLLHRLGRADGPTRHARLEELSDQPSLDDLALSALDFE
jgi:hypothetical protein